MTDFIPFFLIVLLNSFVAFFFGKWLGKEKTKTFINKLHMSEIRTLETRIHNLTAAFKETEKHQTLLKSIIKNMKDAGQFRDPKTKKYRKTGDVPADLLPKGIVD